MKLKPVKVTRKPWHTDEYIAYLASDEWVAIRAAALERAGHRCEYRIDRTEWCGETRGLQVHHVHYVRFGHERPEDLQVLCKAHHERADRDRQRSERNATLKRKYGDWRPKT